MCHQQVKTTADKKTRDVKVLLQVLPFDADRFRATGGCTKSTGDSTLPRPLAPIPFIFPSAATLWVFGFRSVYLRAPTKWRGPIRLVLNGLPFSPRARRKSAARQLAASRKTAGSIMISVTTQRTTDFGVFGTEAFKK
jgi:hypothetical protein